MTLSRRNVIILAIVTIVAVVVLMWSMRSSSAIDDYVAQLRAKGEQLYYTDPPLPKMTNGTPGLDKFVTAADSLVSLSPIKVMDVNPTGVAEVAWRRLPRLDGMGSASIQWPQLLGVLQTNDKALREIRESLTYPEPDEGWETNAFTYRRIFVQERWGAQMLTAATVAALHETNYDEAFANLQALAHLAQMESNATTLVAQMIRIAITGLGVATTWEALQSDGLSDAQWSQLQAEWGKVDLLTTMERGFVGERLHVFNYIERARRGETNVLSWFRPTVTWRDRVGTVVWRATVAQQDEMYYLRTLERYIEDCRLASRGTSAVEVNKMFQNEVARLDGELRKPLSRYRYPLSLIAIPNFTRASAVAFHNEIQRRLAITAIGIKRYQLRHGRLPETLQQLVPECCPEVLLDPMDWKPLRYRTKADGTFTLYSVGDNGKDDGGSAIVPTNSPVGWLHGLDDGLDIVWPRAAQTNGNN